MIPGRYTSHFRAFGSRFGPIAATAFALIGCGADPVTIMPAGEPSADAPAPDNTTTLPEEAREPAQVGGDGDRSCAEPFDARRRRTLTRATEEQCRAALTRYPVAFVELDIVACELDPSWPACDDGDTFSCGASPRVDESLEVACSAGWRDDACAEGPAGWTACCPGETILCGYTTPIQAGLSDEPGPPVPMTTTCRPEGYLEIGDCPVGLFWAEEGTP